MTLQEIFDTVVSNLIAQGGRSIHKERYEHKSPCAYRGANGRKCAAGWLIPDELYRPDMEDDSATHIFENSEELLDVIGRDGLDDKLALIRRLQSIHDGDEEWEPRSIHYRHEEWKREFKDAAMVWNLKWKFEEANWNE